MQTMTWKQSITYNPCAAFTAN